MQKYNKSKQLLKQAFTKIPALTQTFSKGPQTFGFEGVPHYVAEAKGVIVIDVDGNKYIDYSMGLGSVLLGHAEPRVNAAVIEQIANGHSFSLMHPLELEVTDIVLNLCPWADMVRFGKNGSDVMSAAVRLARAVTGRDMLAIATDYGTGSPNVYHGWNDWSATLSNMPAGVPASIRQLTTTFQFNNVGSLFNLFKKHKNRIAAVILEGAKFTAPKDEFVHALNTIPSHNGALLVVDEVANGLRLSSGGAHERFKINPDMVAFGKSFGNGVPISILAGKKKCMTELNNVMFTLTYGGETLGLAAAKKVIQIYNEENIFQKINIIGEKLWNAVANIIESLDLSQKIGIFGFPSRFTILPLNNLGQPDYDMALKMRKLLLENGIICAGVHNISPALREEHISKTIKAYKISFEQLWR
jgi:glutamate-1-semialdehyde aminotransferase